MKAAKGSVWRIGRWPVQRAMCAVLLVLAVASWAREARGATQTYNGDPIRFTITDTGTPNVEVRPPGGGDYVGQYRGGADFGSVVWFKYGGIWYNYSTGYGDTWGLGTITKKSNVYSAIAGGGGKIETTLGLGGVSLELKQTFSHRPGDRFITKEWVFTKSGLFGIQEIIFYHGGNAFPHGSDNGHGGYDDAKKMVYAWNEQSGWEGAVMGFYADPSTPSSGYFEGNFATGNGHANEGTNLPNTVVGTSKDTGYYLQWNRGGLSSGESWTIRAYEVWTGGLEVIPQVDRTFLGGETTQTATFTVKNTDVRSMNGVVLSASTDRGWDARVIDANPVSIAGGTSVVVTVEVTVPDLATGPAVVTLEAAGGVPTSVATGSMRLSPVFLSVGPTEVFFRQYFETRSPGETIVVTNTSAVPLTVGAVKSGDPAFVLIEDGCSGLSVPAGGTCEIVVVYEARGYVARNDGAIEIGFAGSDLVEYVYLDGSSIGCETNYHWNGRSCVEDDPTDPDNPYTCLDGYHWDGGKCVENDPTDPDNPYACLLGYHWDGKKCVSDIPDPHSCATGYHWNGAGCFVDGSDPKSCATGYHWNGEECFADGLDPKSCTNDYHWDGEKCVPSGPMPYTCLPDYHWDGKKCVTDDPNPHSCASGYHWNGEECIEDDPADPENPYTCLGGYHWDGEECVEDDSIDPDNPYTCLDGHHWDGKKCVPSDPTPYTCLLGYHWDGKKCMSDIPDPHSCATGYHWNGAECFADGSDPKSCATGYHWNGAECFADGSDSKSCATGYHWNGAECFADGSDPKSCATGHHWNGAECFADGSDPKSCATGYHWNGAECFADGSDPKSCASGYHWNGDACVPNASNASSCADGYHWNGEECIADRSNPRLCLPGYHWDGERCVSEPCTCATGYHWDGVECVSDDPDPETCADGYYWDGEECLELETVPPPCQPDFHWNGVKCVSDGLDPFACARGYYWKDGEGCVPPEAPTILEPSEGDLVEGDVVISGTATPGMAVVVTIDGEAACTAVADETGRWSCSVSGLEEGDHTIVASVTDDDGQTLSSGPLLVTVDAGLGTAFHGGSCGCSAEGGGTASFAWLTALLAAGAIGRRRENR